MTATRTVDRLVRLAGAAALILGLILGLALWGGRLHGLVGLHVASGVAVVLGLWALAALALRRGRSRGLAAGALAWGLGTLALGTAQAGLLVGDLHRVVQVAHLLLGLGAVALAAALARTLVTSRPAASS